MWLFPKCFSTITWCVHTGGVTSDFLAGKHGGGFWAGLDQPQRITKVQLLLLVPWAPSCPTPSPKSHFPWAVGILDPWGWCCAPSGWPCSKHITHWPLRLHPIRQGCSPDKSSLQRSLWITTYFHPSWALEGQGRQEGIQQASREERQVLTQTPERIPSRYHSGIHSCRFGAFCVSLLSRCVVSGAVSPASRGPLPPRPVHITSWASTGTPDI